MALFQQGDPGVQRPVLQSLRAPSNPVLGPQRGLEAQGPHHPDPDPLRAVSPTGNLGALSHTHV